MKILRIENRTVSEKVPDEAVEIMTVPNWLALSFRQTCDACRYPLDGADSVQAVRCRSGKVLLIHAVCQHRLSSA